MGATHGRFAAESLESSRRALQAAEQALAIAEDRDRIATELSENLIQRLFAAVLQLEVAGQMDEPSRSERIRASIRSLDDTIAEVRSAVFALRADATSRSAADVRVDVMDMVTELAEARGASTSVELSGDAVPNDSTARAMTLLRAGITEVVEHAHATRVAVRLSVEPDCIVVHLDHDGRLAAERRHVLDELAARHQAQLHVAERDDNASVSWVLNASHT